MTENDKPAENQTSLAGFDTDTEGDDDIHYCKRCRLMFTSLRDYVDHKVNHDNFKVTYQRTGRGNRGIVPKLVQKPETPKDNESAETLKEIDASKENEVVKRRGRKKKKKIEEIDPELVMTEKPEYWCPKCDQRFNREATLRRHVEYVHDRLGDYTSVVDEEDGGEESDSGEGSIGRVVQKGDNANNNAQADENSQDVEYKKMKVKDSSDKSDRPYICSICHLRFKEINVLKFHMLTHSNKRDYACTVDGCKFAFKTKGSLKRHMRRHTGERPYTCNACGRTFTESGSLTRHMKSRIPCVNKSDNDLPRYRKRWSFSNTDTADQGSKQGTVISNAIEIIEQSTDSDGQTMLQAEVMDNVEISDITEAAEEVLSAEDGIPIEEVIRMSEDNLLDNIVHQCRVCKEEMPLEVLRIHLRTHLADLPYKCGLCHFVAEKKEELNSHMLNLHQCQLKGVQDDVEMTVSQDVKDNKEKQNEMAKEAVKQLLELPQTKAVEGDGTPRTIYKCPVCSKPFRGNSNLRLHLKTHTGDRPYKCSNCEKSFVTKDTLAKHMSAHSDERSYKCGECGKLFKRISHVREHLKIHSSDRPFPCSVCDKSFKTCNAMKVHLRTHTDIMPYVCQFCKRHFREKGSLMRHRRMHTGERPYSCKHCGKCFSEHGTLNRHLKAKVPCSRQLGLMRQEQEETDYPTVLAEFSSVVADTQEYIATIGEDENAVETIQTDGQTEYVVVREEDLQDVEIITEVIGNDVNTTTVEAVHLTDEYVVVTDGTEGMKILDSKTGETIAMMPLSSLTDGDNQTIAMVDNEIEAVAMVPDIDINDSLVQQAMLTANVVEEQVETTIPDSEVLP